MKSLDHFDYEEEDLEYFASQIRKFSPDIVCMQENHSNEDRSVARELAGLLGHDYVYEEAISLSHVDPQYRLGMAIIAKQPFEHIKTTMYPYPEFPLFFSDGRPAEVHHKALQVVSFEGLMVANTQMLPLGVFGAAYDKGEGKDLAREIDRVLYESLTVPFVFCGDFNFNSPATIYPEFFSRSGASDALPDVLTRPNKEGLKKTPDHILFSGPELVRSEVLETQSDHYLCFAEFSY